ncbi:MAG: peptidoglycan/LPS O-acetylase OafA/YrhL [Lysobacterales bacterium]
MFLKNLESLRGVAALMVALCHCLLVVTVDGLNNIWFTPFSEVAGIQSGITRFLLLFLNGGAAVVVFFVLSGYVLGLSLDKHRITIKQTFGFYVKRIFRLYPAHIVVLIGIVNLLIGFFNYQEFEAASAWYTLWYESAVGGEQVVKNLTLMAVDLNHIAWSLQVELAGSLFLPFAYLIARRANFWVNILMLAALVALSKYSSNLLLIFLYCFYAGLILPQAHQKMGDLLTGTSGTLILILGAILLFGGFTLVGSKGLFERVLLETAGGVLIIAYLISQHNADSGINRFLSVDIINRLGRYSYSFYLLHFFILYLMAYAMFQLVSAEILSSMPLLFGIALMLVSVPVTFWLSGKVYQYVEVPMVKVGKKLVGA